MRVLTGNDVSEMLRNLTPHDATRLLDALSSGLASYTTQKSIQDASKHEINQPQRTVFQTRDQNTVLVMPVSDSEVTAVKCATVPNTGAIQGAITVYSPVGELKGTLNAAEITAFRTALATMTLLIRWKAPSSPQVVVFGSGKQAEWHVRLVLLLIPGVRRVTAVNRGKNRLEDLERHVISELKHSHPDVEFETIAQQGNDAYRSDLNKRLAEADIICCCTPSTEPLFSAADLQAGPAKARFLSLIGSYKPSMQEIDTETLRLADSIWVDSKEACLEEAGELIRADMSQDDLDEVGDLFSRDADEKNMLDVKPPSLTVFKCVGLGIMDLIIAKALLRLSEETGKGTVIQGF